MANENSEAPKDQAAANMAEYKRVYAMAIEAATDLVLRYCLPAVDRGEIAARLFERHFDDQSSIQSRQAQARATQETLDRFMDGYRR